jgi:hypothetical protein
MKETRGKHERTTGLKGYGVGVLENRGVVPGGAGTREVRTWYCALPSRRRCFRALFPLHRPHGKKIMPAGFATQRGKTKDAPDNRGYARHALGGDALQFEVPANPAVCVEESAKRHQAGVKSRLAGFAAPRQDARDAQEIVQYRPPFGTPAIRTAANRTAYEARADGSTPRQE